MHIADTWAVAKASESSSSATRSLNIGTACARKFQSRKFGREVFPARKKTGLALEFQQAFSLFPHPSLRAGMFEVDTLQKDTPPASDKGIQVSVNHVESILRQIPRGARVTPKDFPMSTYIERHFPDGGIKKLKPSQWHFRLSIHLRHDLHILCAAISFHAHFDHDSDEETKAIYDEIRAFVRKAIRLLKAGIDWLNVDDLQGAAKL